MAIRNIIREIEPEACDFSYYFDNDGIREAGGDFCYNLFIVSFDRWNRVEGFQADVYREIVREIENIYDAFQEVKENAGKIGYYSSYKEAMNFNGLNYNPRLCHALKDFFLDPANDGNDLNDPETVAAYLTITTGRPWDVVSARGYCQGDFCSVVYCKDFHKEPQAYGEIYLGAGKEFCVIDLDDDGNELDAVYGYIVADCQAWKDEDYKRLVCEWAGIKPEETELQMIDYDTRRTIVKYDYRTA